MGKNTKVIGRHLKRIFKFGKQLKKAGDLIGKIHLLRVSGVITVSKLNGIASIYCKINCDIMAMQL